MSVGKIVKATLASTLVLCVGHHAKPAETVQKQSDVFDSSPIVVPPDASDIDEQRISDPNIRMRSRSITSDGKVEMLDSSAALLERLQDFQSGNYASNAKQMYWDVGGDKREIVQHTERFPYHAIGQLGNGCTGTLVGPRYVLTAAHCVFNLKTKKFYSNLQFYPGRNGETVPFGTIRWHNAFAPEEYAESGNPEYDFGLVILNAPDIYNKELSWLTYGVEDSLPPQTTINMAGYPSEKQPYNKMWYQGCRIQISQPKRIFHDCDSTPGNSGSPLYAYYPGSDARIIIGIHAHGFQTDIKFNGGTRITREVYERILLWMTQKK